MRTPDTVRPSSRRLSASVNRAELRQALRRDNLSWYPRDIYLVGEDGPFEDRPVADGAVILWEENGRLFVDLSERGRVDTTYAWVFTTEAEACRWVYDRAYVDRFEPAAETLIRYLNDVQDPVAAVRVSEHHAAMARLRQSLTNHARHQPRTPGL